MDVAALLTTLGVNQTIYYQFTFFVITYMCLHFLLFKPYFHAYHERLNRTEGSQEASERLLVEAEDLKVQYESKAREINANFKAVYDETRTQALHEYDEITNRARQQAREMLADNKLKIETEFKTAKSKIKSEVDGISDGIVSKLLG